MNKIRNRKNLVVKLLILIEIAISLIGSMDMFSKFKEVFTSVQFMVLGLLLIEIIYSIHHNMKLYPDEFIGGGFIFFTVVSILWSNNLNIYDYVTSCLQIVTAFIIYIANKRYGDEEFDLIVMRMFRIMLCLDVILVSYQVLKLNINSDFSNGIFGSLNYYNGVQGLYCIVCCCYSLFLCFLNKQSKNLFIFDILICCLICSLSEIKAFFFLIIPTILLYILFVQKIERSVMKKFLRVLGVLIVIFLAFNILGDFYGQNTAVFNNKKSLLQYLGYRNEGYSRGTRFGDIEFFFSNDLNVIALGNGFSEGIRSSVYGLSVLLNSIGVIGVALLLLFFVEIIIAAKKKSRFDFLFATMCTAQCFIAEIVWAGIFGHIVSYFSFLMLAIVSRKR